MKRRSDDYKMISSILNGESFESYGERTGVSKQSVNKRFWFTFVNLFPSFEYMAKDKDINKLRKVWGGFDV